MAGRIPIWFDGGVRSGIDALKALALGADLVFVGRPILWGLATQGQQGVEAVLDLLDDELKRAMVLSGVASISEIKKKEIIHLRAPKL